MKINQVNKVWTKSPQEMLDYIIQVDKECHGVGELYSPSFYIGKSLSYIREVYEQYVGLESLSQDEQIQNGYYRLEIE